MSQEKPENEPEIIKKTIEIEQIQYLVQNGNSYAYIVNGQDIYRMPVSQDETIILASVGERIQIEAYQEENGVYALLSVKRLSATR